MQEHEFANYATIDYTMYHHDVETIAEFRHYKDDINKKLREGWVILHIGNDADGEVNYVMGQPRPKLCRGSFSATHEETVKSWHHRRKEWLCPVCSLF